MVPVPPVRMVSELFVAVDDVQVRGLQWTLYLDQLRHSVTVNPIRGHF